MEVRYIAELVNQVTDRYLMGKEPKFDLELFLINLMKDETDNTKGNTDGKC